MKIKHAVCLVTMLSAGLSAGSVLAQPYVGLEWQLKHTAIGVKEYQQLELAGKTLNLRQDDKDTGARLFAGYRFGNNVGVELGYSGFQAGAGYEVRLSPLEDEEWDAELTVQQLELLATYNYALSERLALSAGAGLIWHHADFSFSHKIDVEDAPDQLLTAGSSDKRKSGVVARLGLQYNLWQTVDVLAGYQYSRSSLADSPAIYSGLQYRF